MHLVSCVGQERLSGPKAQASRPHRHRQAGLEAPGPSLATEGFPDGAYVPENHIYIPKTAALSSIPRVQSTFPENFFSPFCFKQDYDIFRQERNGRRVDEVRSGQDSPCQGIL